MTSIRSILMPLFALGLSLAACNSPATSTKPFPTKSTSAPTSITTSPTPTSSTTSPTMISTTSTSPSDKGWNRTLVQSPKVKGPVILSGDGIGNAVFNQSETLAISNLEKVLGLPDTAAPQPTNNCTVDSYLRFPGLTADFDKNVFVGYSTGSLLGINHQILNSKTTKGLRIGDTLAQAQQIYGSSLRTSYAQGGSWFASTSSGTLAGLTTNEINQSNPPPIIADITAGSVGCPAVSP